MVAGGPADGVAISVEAVPVSADLFGGRCRCIAHEVADAGGENGD